jgi:hypothetical protein
VQDLSSLAKDSLWVTSQEGGNMMSGRPGAMSAPGSEPVTPLPPTKDQGVPHVDMGPQQKPGDDGKPAARTTAGKPDLPPPAWKPTTTPDVVRDTTRDRTRDS